MDGVSENPFSDEGNLTWSVSESAPDLLFYQDEFNSEMWGMIFVHNATTPPSPPPVDCLSIMNCSQCISYPECNWCSSSSIQGCINNTAQFDNACRGLGGSWGNCDAVGKKKYKLHHFFHEE